MCWPPRVPHGGLNTPTRELGRLMTRAGRLQFIMLMCVFLGFVAVGRPFVVLWAKGDASFAIDYPVAIFAVSLHHHVLHPVRGAGDPAGQGDAQVPGLGLSGGGRRQRGADDPPCAGSGVCWALPAASLSSHCWETSCPSTGTTAKGSGWM